MSNEVEIDRQKGIAAIEVVKRMVNGILFMTDSEIKALFGVREEVDLIEVSRPLCVVLGNQHPVMVRIRKVTFK